MIEAELGNTIARLFLDFEEEPVAAASIGQVHRATLPNGKRVAVKVQRPGAQRQIESDVQLMYEAARLVKERVRSLDFIDARGLVDEFARQLRTSSTTGSRAATRRRSTATSPTTATAVPEGVLAIVPQTRADARVLRRQEASIDKGRGSRGPTASRGCEARHRDHHRLDDSRGRLLPRRPAPGQRHHPRGGGHDRPRRLRRGGGAQRRGHVEADAACSSTRRRRTSTCCRSGWPISASSYPKEREEEFVAELTRDLLPLLRREPRGDRPDPGHPRGVPADLLDEPAAADAVPAARPRDRDARLGRDRAVSELQRVRGRASVRARADGGAVHAGPRSRGARGAMRCATRRSRARRRSSGTTSWSRSATARSRSASSTRGWTSSSRSMQKVFNRLVIALIVAGGLIGSAMIGVFATAGPTGARGQRVLGRSASCCRRFSRCWLLLGRRPFRPVVDELLHFRAEGHLARGGARRYLRRNDRAAACGTRAVRARLPRAAARERRLRRPLVRQPRRPAALGRAGRVRARRRVGARALLRAGLSRDRARRRRRRRCACARSSGATTI